MASKKVVVEAGPNDQTVDLYDDEDFGNGLRYGRWEDNKKNGRYLLPEYLSGSDYSGSLVQKSNHKVFSERFADGYGEWWTDPAGGHGTYSILIDMKNVPEDIETDVAEFLNALHDYPLADDEDHSKMEMEAQNEAWDDWACKDFTRAIEKEFDVELDDVDSEKIFELFREAADASNTYWENQSGGDMYIDIARVMKKVKEDDVAALLKE